MLAEAYRQMAYQAEAGPWRDIYLSGAHDLQGGAKIVRYDAAASKAFLQQVPLGTIYESPVGDGWMGKRLRVRRCRLILPSPMSRGEVNNNFVMTIRNSVMHYRRVPKDETADATLTPE